MNKIASVILLDVGCKQLSLEEDSFFAQSKRCLSRLILRKMFAEDGDDMGIILFGSEVTENCMPERDRDKYCNIRELCTFGKASYAMYELVESLSQCKGYKSDWVLGTIVALQYIKNGITGRRYKMKQIVIISEFPTRLNYQDSTLNMIAGCMKDMNIKLTVIGPEIDEENPVADSMEHLITLFGMVNDPLKLSIDELSESLKYYEKKRKTKRVFNIDLEIGSLIKIPVGWTKLTSESQRFTNWVDKEFMERRLGMGSTEMDGVSSSGEPSEPADVDDVSSLNPKESTDDTFKITKFGRTDVTFSSADLNALKRESGPPSFKVLLFTNKSQVNPTMYVGQDIFVVVPREGSNYSKAKLYALIDAMKDKNKVCIARRIVMKNGKIQLGVLIPFSDEAGKHLFFMKLPTAEWTQPFPRMRSYPTIDASLKDSFKQLINAMILPPDLTEEGQGLLVHDPNFQLRCHLIAERARDPSADHLVVPEYIQQIINPCPEFEQNTRDIADRIMQVLPLLNTATRKQATKDRALARAARKLEKRSNNELTSNFTNIKTSNDDISGNARDSNSGPSTIKNEMDITIKNEMDITFKNEIDLDEPDAKQFNDLLKQLVSEELPEVFY